MKQNGKQPKTIDDYISRFPEDVQVVLEKVRTTIKKAAPKAEEIISYQMPAFRQNGNLVYFAGWKDHISFYPVSSAIKAFEKELTPYEPSKGTVKFPIDKRMPLGLISRMVKFRVKENLEKENAKKRKS
jgi:uncharacterized protein YdhG (YjbR/CyaY superfamily)